MTCIHVSHLVGKDPQGLDLPPAAFEGLHWQEDGFEVEWPGILRRDADVPSLA